MIAPVKATVTLMVTDLNDSIKFYTEILGLSLVQNYDGHYAEIDLINIRLGLHPANGQVFASAGSSIGIEVQNLQKAAQSLVNHGVNCHISNDGWAQLGNFKDPDGHVFYMMERHDDY